MNDVIKFRPAATSAMERANVPSVCDCCGREDLKKTVKVTNGETTLWMGTGCAAKACGMGIREFGKALGAEQTAQEAAERAAEEKAWREHNARWQAHLDARCPELRGDRFRQIQALGGGKAARDGFAG